MAFLRRFFAVSGFLALLFSTAVLAAAPATVEAVQAPAWRDRGGLGATGGEATMRRWNGWGDDSVELNLGAPVLEFLAAAIGQGTAPRDASLDAACAAVAAQVSRLPAHDAIDTAAAATPS